VFHGRLENGRLQFGSVNVALEDTATADGGATVSVRPHQLTLENTPSNGERFRAKVVHINAAGATVKVQLRAPWGDVVRVEVGREQYRALALTCDAEVFVGLQADSLYLTVAGSGTAGG